MITISADRTANELYQIYLINLYTSIAFTFGKTVE